MEATLLIQNAAQVVTPYRSTEEIATSRGMGSLRVIQNGAVAIQGEQIIAVDVTPRVLDRITISDRTTVISAAGKTITPGLVDPHTHPVFYATREHEFEMRISGKSYQEIARAGGGIRSSVRSVRKTGQKELVAAVLPRLQLFLENGVTTIEAKSGYGLSVEDEIKSLEVIQVLNQMQPIEIVPTFLGAHEIPDEYQTNRAAYIRLIIEEMIPMVAKRKLAEFCDVFCEDGVYGVEEARQILLAGQRVGLRSKIHANQLSANGGAQLASEISAISAEHLDYITPAEIEAMVQARVIPVLLPSAVFYLKLNRFAPARQMINAGAPVALSTDFNPGTSMTEALPFIMTLACIQMQMTPAEALIATTLNAAMAINRQQLVGSLESGKQADLVIWNIPNYYHLAYHFGVTLAATVIKRGKICYQKNVAAH
ncbi:imidazolonepropionase [candidate division KSB1 bacterium]|nr:imidazolonepropionase [candidate division KSB1 bacterium]